MARVSDKRFDGFRERQRQQSREKFNPFPKRKKKPEPPIPVKPFNGIPEIQPLNVSDYSNLAHAVNRVISPGKSLEKAVACVMINLLLSHSGIYEPGKSYSRAERQYTGGQLKVFAESLSGLEVSFGYYLEGSGIGRLKDKERNEVRDLKSIIENDLWEGEGNYHIVYVRNLSKVVPKKDSFDAEELVIAIVEKRYKAEIKELESFSLEFERNKDAYEKESAKFEEFLKAQGVDKDAATRDEEAGLRIFNKYLKQYLDETPDMADTERKFLTTLVKGMELKHQIEQEVQEEMKNLPDEAGIATRLSKNIKPNGILILESTEVKDIPGLRLVGSYDGVRLYQKE